MLRKIQQPASQNESQETRKPFCQKMVYGSGSLPFSCRHAECFAQLLALFELTLNTVFLILQSLLTQNLFPLCTPSVFCFCPINSCQYSKGSKIKQQSRYASITVLCNCCSEEEQIGQNWRWLWELPQPHLASDATTASLSCGSHNKGSGCTGQKFISLINAEHPAYSQQRPQAEAETAPSPTCLWK